MPFSSKKRSFSRKKERFLLEKTLEHGLRIERFNDRRALFVCRKPYLPIAYHATLVAAKQFVEGLVFEIGRAHV